MKSDLYRAYEIQHIFNFTLYVVSYRMKYNSWSIDMKKIGIISVLALFLGNLATLLASSYEVIVTGYFSESDIRRNFKKTPMRGNEEIVEVGGNFLGYGKKRIVSGNRAVEAIQRLEGERMVSVHSEATLYSNIIALSQQISELIAYKRSLTSFYITLDQEKDSLEGRLSQAQQENSTLKRTLFQRDNTIKGLNAERNTLLARICELESQVKQAKEGNKDWTVETIQQRKQIASAHCPESFDQTTTKRTPNNVLSDQNINEISKITGYSFKNRELLRKAFTHSSQSDGQLFPCLASLGDRTASFFVFSSFDTKVLFSSPDEMHNQWKDRTNNEFFSKQYQHLGLDKFLSHNPGSKTKAICADAFEALIGAMVVDWVSAHPRSPRGQVFPALFPILDRLIQSDHKPFSTLSAVNTSQKIQTKVHQTITIRKVDGSVMTQKAKGMTVEDAKHNAMLALWPQVHPPIGKEIAKKWPQFNEECRKRGYNVIA